MVDHCGRTIRYLRISVTDRCNLRCVYCMPKRGIQWVDHHEILSYEEILRLARIFARLGIDRVRLTGGEPLVRKGLSQLVSGLKAVPGIDWVGVTTNGILLEEQLPDLLAAGLDGVNLSLDTLDRAQYAAITRRDMLESALRGLAAARNAPGLNVKVNCVPWEANAGQWVSLAAMAKEEPAIDVRFIELMPIGLGGGMEPRLERYVLARLEETFGPAFPCPGKSECGPGRYVRFPGFAGRVGFISAMSHQFCRSCNRVRLTADGVLKPCLQYDSGLDLRALLRSGEDEEILAGVIRQAIYNKPVSHHFGTAHTPGDESRNMNQIGG